VIDMFSVLKIVFGTHAAKQSWASASGCRLPGIKTPGSHGTTQSLTYSEPPFSVAPARSHSVPPSVAATPIDPHQSYLMCKKSISTWAKKQNHRSYWSAYNAFKGISKHTVKFVAADILNSEMFKVSLKSIDPRITAETASQAFKYCDRDKDRSLNQLEFQQLLPQLDSREPIWMTRKHIRLAATPPNPQQKLGTTTRTFPKLARPAPKHGWPWLTECVSAPDRDSLNLKKPKFVRKLPVGDYQNCLFGRRPHSRGDPLENDAQEFCHEWHWREANAHKRCTLNLLEMGIKGDYRDYMVAKYGLER